MKKPFIVLLHAGFWLCFLLIIGLMLGVFYRSLPPDDLAVRMVNALGSVLLFAGLPSLLCFYACYLLVFPAYLQQKKFLTALFAGLGSALLAALISYALLQYAIATGWLTDMDKRGNSAPPKVVFVMTLIAMTSGTVALVIRGFITWVEEIKLKEELKQRNRDTEMALIKAQLDPHFLFNTLNNIDVLITRQPERASGYLNQLSDILRFMLYETKTDQILLEKEIEYLSKYIALQKIRTANAHYVQLEVTGDPSQVSVAPMLFIPFVENAFKHTGNKKLEDAILIRLLVDQEKIVFSCENKTGSYQQGTERNNKGLGNVLIQQRLQLLYPGKHRLEISAQEDLYRVYLVIHHG